MRILLVDDHPMVRAGLRAVLRNRLPVARIAEAGTGAEALSRARTWKPDLVLLDLNLPGMNGLDVSRRLRAVAESMRVLIVAAEVNPWTVREALAAGASGYLVKTCAVDELRTAIRSIMDGRVYLCHEAEAVLRQADPECAVPPAEPPGVAVLSRREQQVLQRIAIGQTTIGIAADLHVSPKTIEAHRRHVMIKLGLDNVAALTRYAIRHGLIPA